MERQIFKINLKKKQQIHKKYIKSNKIFGILSKGLIAVIIIFNVCFLIYGFGFSSTFVVSNVFSYQYGQKNIALIVCITAGVNAILLFLWLIQKIVVKEVTGRFISQRINESLAAENGYLEYGYQNFAVSHEGDRVVIRIPLDKIYKIGYDEKIQKIQITGLMCSRYYDDYLRRKTRAKEEYDKDIFITFDYYEPPLIQYLQENRNGQN